MSHSPSAAPSIAGMFADSPVIAVIRIESAERAVDLGRALIAAGVQALEITLRTPQACEAIRRIRAELPEALVGAGTVLNRRDLEQVAEAGARFAIAPGATEALYRAGAEVDLPLITGVATASELMLGLEHGHDCFKFFPAEAAGGRKLLQSWAGPFPQARFIPTGGISPTNAPDYLALPNVVAVGGSWMVPEDAIAAGDWARIASLAGSCQTLRVQS